MKYSKTVTTTPNEFFDELWTSTRGREVSSDVEDDVDEVESDNYDDEEYE